ncbi:Enoyl-[acyl-carrier-protein] reductase, mitochondrial [Labeo rohita]|uniref:Enoyl-[acyl-carrier-protein] reductase, mitochondrial n=1 Tax=Labeo rohita TaxID=84645 RepID=A0ABQ8LR59_LABRO|nr:Enoyl-[acyl-carrier-protein] reductase, mitochondrial [Labeo rohita]
MLIRNLLHRAIRDGTILLRNRQRCSTAWRTIHHCSALVYREHSHNIDTVRMEQLPLPAVGDHSVRVRMLAAPVNPADMNMIQGSYPILCPLPAVGGNEGVGEVIEVGREVTSLRPGDWVMPIYAGFDISILGAATIFVNPCTAYRMLHDFQTLTPGCTVIQNASNSAVGQAVIQIAAALGLKTINIIRDRPNCAELIDELQSLGADYVLTEEEVMSTGLHWVFELWRHNGHIWRDGQKAPPDPRNKVQLKAMLDAVCDLMRGGQLSAPHCDQTPFHQYTHALQATMQSHCRKHVLIM